MIFKCIIIDDEPLSRKVLENHIGKVNFLECIAQFGNCIEAIDFLNNNKVDLIFLDINMPELTGMEFLKTIRDLPDVIITTAYSEYALESYEYAVKDYLLKPISFARFIKAVNKLNISTPEKIIPKKLEDEFIFVKSDKLIHKIFVKEIFFIKSVGNYIDIQLKDRNYLVQDTLANFLNSLPDSFIQCHKSYIVSLQYVDSVNGNMINTKIETIPVGRHFRKSFIDKLNMFSSNKLSEK